MSDVKLLDRIKKLEDVIREKDKIIEDLKNGSGKLTNEEINRYSRQILLPNIGVKGQLTLKKSSVLIVGAGGLGCPCGLYLAGAGVGHLGIVDYDELEVNNLHRQILHTESDIGAAKVDSAEKALKNINSCLRVTAFKIQLDSSNALNVVDKFDVVVDATDNVATRYLLNDACVMLGKPLVSGSALKMEGQLTVYNYKTGPCYRCVFPVPPPPETVTNCGSGGVLGVIPGTIGVLQALETIKVLLNQNPMSGSLLLFDGMDSTFRKVKLRQRNTECVICGDSPTIKHLVDYEQFCGAKANDKNPDLKLLPNERRLSAMELRDVRRESPHILVDVRSKAEFTICQLPKSINIPITDITTEKAQRLVAELKEKDCQVLVICRRGNDSQKAVLELDKLLPAQVVIKDIVGGLHAWAREVDNTFPVY